MDEYVISVAANMGLLSFLALSAYVLLIGGEMSFGQQAFFAVGAYAAGMATAVARMPLVLAIALAAICGAIAAALLALATQRLRGLYFAMGTLAAAEAVRLVLEIFSYRQEIAGDAIGPDGAAGFGGIRRFFELGFTPGDTLLLIYGVLAAILVALFLCERSRFGVALRMAGEDEQLAAATGIDVARVKLVAATAAGLIAALGGALYAHYNTYVEPRNFDMMLGVHGLAYALIGGLGTPFAPLCGVAADILLLESSRLFPGHRMIVFGGLVAVMLIVRPRGLLDERAVHGLRCLLRRAR
ncbi:MAG: branched-chain amino acid ABC transporter permease [Betaproteobacteria bacterium]